MNKVVPIAIAGAARSGKDTLATLLSEEFKKLGFKSKRLAFADPIKQDLDKFCKKNFGISAFTQKNEEKAIIRPLFVGYGDAKREQTNGTHFVKILSEKVDIALQSEFTIPIISDLRFAEFESDETQTLKHQYSSMLVFLKRRDKNGVFIEPANEREAKTLPKVEKLCTHFVEWDTEDNKGDLREYAKLLVSDYMKTNEL